MRRSLVALALAVTLPLPGLAGQVTVKEGETLSQIAERNGISLSRLMQLNGIRNADQVEAGQTLTLPGGGGGSSSQASRTAAAGTVIVKPGETLSEIAERHGLGLSQLMQINGIRKADQVEAGQTLRLRAAGQPPARTVTAAAPPTYPRGAKEHVVRPGESLSVIADGYGVGMSKLIAINSISDPNHVEAGTRLKLKGTPPAPASPAPAAATRAVAPTPRPAVTTATSAAAARPQPHSQPTAAATTTHTAPATRPAATTAARPAATAPRPATPAVAGATPTAGTTVAMASPDWRSYGPLQVNWSAWQPMGGSMVAPSLNGQGQTQYVAINCGARKVNTTSSAGAWQSWSDPSADYEQQLVSDYCRSRS